MNSQRKQHCEIPVQLDTTLHGALFFERSQQVAFAEANTGRQRHLLNPVPNSLLSFSFDIFGFPPATGLFQPDLISPADAGAIFLDPGTAVGRVTPEAGQLASCENPDRESLTCPNRPIDVAITSSRL